MTRIPDPRALSSTGPGRSVDPTIVDGIRQASRATNVDFSYLMTQAGQESGFRANAKASGSSATGLYQFIESTWLDMVRRHGAKYGVGELASSIGTDSAGRPVVADADTRRRVLDLRTDPKLSASLAAEYARSNKQELERTLGRNAGNTDLYLAHFLGPAGAVQFLRGIEQDSGARAADLLPEAAGANRSVFYKPNGEARTVAEIYKSFAAKFEKDVPSPLAVPLETAKAADAPSGGLRPVFGLGRLSEPVAAMLDVIAMSALRIVSGERRHGPTETPEGGERRHDATPA